MDNKTIAALEAKLRRIEAEYKAVHSSLIAAKAAQGATLAQQIIQAGERARGGGKVDLPKDPVARAIVRAAAKARGEE